jgi:hypothetical protein
LSGRPVAPLTVRPTSRLPNFLMIGAMKTGTTSLWHYLRSHPQVFMSDIKEVMFFDPRHKWNRGLDWYERQFEQAPDDTVALGEASTSYTKFPTVRDVPNRIASVLPDVKLIYMVRHPVERMQSHYLYALSRGKESRPIEQAFAEDPAYLDISRYALQLEQYEPYFGRDQFLLLDSRDLRNDRVETLRKVFGFIGVDDTWVPPVVDREFFRSEDRRMQAAYSPTLRRMPRLRAISKHVPEPVRSLARKVTSDPVDVRRAQISDDLRRRLEGSVRDDVAKLRRFMPDGFDGWGLA